MNKRMKQLCRVLAMTLALCLAFPLEATAATIDEVKARQEELAQENAQLEEEIAQLKEDESAALEYQAALEEKIGVTEQKIDAARESIQLMDDEILVLEQKLDAAQAEYQDTLDEFAQRVVALSEGTVAADGPPASALTPELLRLFIQRIEVGERSQKYSRSAGQNVKIVYRDIGRVDSPMQEGEHAPHITKQITDIEEIKRLLA